MKVKLHEHQWEEEFYAEFIQITVPGGDWPSVLVFSGDPKSRELAEKIAGLMGEEWEWVEDSEELWEEGEHE